MEQEYFRSGYVHIGPIEDQPVGVTTTNATNDDVWWIIPRPEDSPLGQRLSKQKGYIKHD